MKVIFMGAPAFAVPALRAVVSTGSEVAAVYTKPPSRSGRRGMEITKTPVHLAAEELGLRVETPATLRRPDPLHELSAMRADIAIIVAYGLLLPVEALAAARLGCYNLHASLLPRWRGAAPVQRAIMAGDKETGISIMRMEAGLDTGPIAGELRTPIDPMETSEELTARLAALAAQTIGENWDALIHGKLAFTPQGAVGVEYARKIDKAEAPIDWTAFAEIVQRHIHGLSPFPGAVAEIRVGATRERLKILRAEIVRRQGSPGMVLDERLLIACGRDAIRVLKVQRSGRKVISGEDFMRSGVLRVGDALARTT